MELQMELLRARIGAPDGAPQSSKWSSSEIEMEQIEKIWRDPGENPGQDPGKDLSRKPLRCRKYKAVLGIRCLNNFNASSLLHRYPRTLALECNNVS
jgi:hypothetical protein